MWNRDYSLKGDVFSVNTLSGRRRMHFAKPASSLDGKFGTAKLVHKHGKFYLHIPVTHEVPDVSDDKLTDVVGIDRGIRFIAAAFRVHRSRQSELTTRHSGKSSSVSGHHPQEED